VSARDALVGKNGDWVDFPLCTKGIKALAVSVSVKIFKLPPISKGAMPTNETGVKLLTTS
jgi:hypothetical protein